MKARFDQSAISIANGAKLLCQKAHASDCGRTGVAPNILLMAPPPITQLTSAIRAEFDGAVHKSKLLAKHFSDVASQLNIHFVDAAEFITTSITDPVHWDGAAHHIVGQIVADRVNQVLSKLKVA